MNTSNFGTLIPLAEAPSILPGNPSVARIRQWYRRGIRGRRLPITRVGGRIWIDPEVLSQFAVSVDVHCPDGAKRSVAEEAS